jgi:hypothetical protein
VDFLTDQQCTAWAAAQGVPLPARPRSSALETAGYHSVHFEIPSDAGRRIALARLLWEAATPYPVDSLLWITEWGVWASGEHMPLVRQLRERFGERRDLQEAPGHVFAAGEDDVALSFLAIAPALPLGRLADHGTGRARHLCVARRTWDRVRP